MSYSLADSIDVEIERILNNSNGKDFKDLRDRACYVFVTGTHPSHLRKPWTRVLSRISRLSNTATALDRRHGNLLLDERIATKLDLEGHPMAIKVREYLAKGYRITISLGSNERKPYTKVFLSRGSGPEEDRTTVQIDGSVLDHWPKR